MGETGRAETITLVNAGQGLLTIDNIFLEGDQPDDYLLDAGACLASPRLPVHISCLMTVRFRPSDAGDRPASLTILTNSLDSPHRVSLTGFGLANPAINFKPDSLNFGQQLLGSASERQPVTVTNVGQGDLTINGISMTGPNPGDFIFTQACTGLALRPGESCFLTVRFMPRLARLRTAELALTGNMPNSPQHLPLLGIGVVTQPDLVITALDLGGSAQINPKDQVEVPIRLLIKNQGNAEAGLFKISTQSTGPGGTFTIPFTVPGQPDLWYPFTSVPLSAGSEILLAGLVTLPASSQGETVSLVALADSCDGDELLPTSCRVEESREDNNLSGQLSLALPDSPVIE